MLTPAPPPGRRAHVGGFMFAMLLSCIALPAPLRAAAVPIWTDEFVPAPGDLNFGNGSLRVSTTEQPHIAFYKDSSGTRTLVYAYRVAQGQWHVEYVLTTSDLAGGAPVHPGPWLGLDEDLDTPTIVYTRQTGSGSWGVWRAVKSGASWTHQLIDVIYPPIQFDATIALSVTHWFSLHQGTVSDTLHHSSLGVSPHQCSALISPGSNVLDPRWMAGATTEAGAPMGFVLSDNDPFFNSSSVRMYSHPDGGLALEAAFRSSPSFPPYLSTPISASQNPFDGTSISGGPTAVLEGGGGSWTWNADNDHPVLARGPFGETQDLSYVDFSPVVYSYVPAGSDYQTVLTAADFFQTWAFSIEGPVSGAVGVPSFSANGRLSTLLTAVEDFTSSRRIRFRGYGALVADVGGVPTKPVAAALRSWPQPARSGGELWFTGFREDGAAEVELFDVSGRRIAVLAGAVQGGRMRAQTPRLGAGVYFARSGTLKGSRVVVAE